jgi:hypothetical protein
MYQPLPKGGSNAAMKRRQRYGTAGSQPVHPLALRPYIKSVRRIIKKLRKQHDAATLDMLRELSSFLGHLPTPRRQNSMRGMPCKQRAESILKHIEQQQSRFRSRPANEGAPVRILCRAIAVDVFPRATSNQQYRRTQVARAIYRLLRADHMTLYGRKVGHRISLQGKGVANRLFSLVEPFYRMWLNEERRKQILSQRWIAQS